MNELEVLFLLGLATFIAGATRCFAWPNRKENETDETRQRPSTPVPQVRRGPRPRRESRVPRARSQRKMDHRDRYQMDRMRRMSRNRAGWMMAGLSGYCPESPEEKRERLYDPRKAASREKSPQPARRSSGS